MNTIRLKIPKGIDTPTEKKVLKLKGSLIARSFTDIIHISDDGEEYHINSFVVAPEKKQEAIDFIEAYLAQNALDTAISILSSGKH